MRYVASNQPHGMPKHLIYVSVAWLMAWEGHKAQETENHALNSNFAKWMS